MYKKIEGTSVAGHLLSTCHDDTRSYSTNLMIHLEIWMCFWLTFWAVALIWHLKRIIVRGVIFQGMSAEIFLGNFPGREIARRESGGYPD